jgi:hypothetical protein
MNLPRVNRFRIVHVSEALALAGALLIGALLVSSSEAAVAAQPSLSRPHPARVPFNNPLAVASDGTHVWVVDGTDSVTELSAKTGGLVRVI